ncbi:MAG: SNF2-related protein, partial [Bdellovibrionaceae bacterium]|nr:SNF2-related protein [Pseudobdellovibrionaceae bacterium]
MENWLGGSTMSWYIPEMPEMNSQDETRVRLTAVIYAQSRLVLWHEGRPEPNLPFTETIPAATAVTDAELSPTYVPLLLKHSDVPRALGMNVSEPHLQTWFQSQAGDLGRFIQYQFSDGTLLTASQILRHEHGLILPRALWPLLMNIPPELRGEHPYRLQWPREGVPRAPWYLEAERVLLGVLLNAQRLAARDGFALLFTQNEDSTTERRAIALRSIALGTEPNAKWVARTAPDLSRTGEEGRVRLALEFSDGERTILRTRHFALDAEQKVLRFHPLWDQVNQVRAVVAGPAGAAGENVQSETIEFCGHGTIQASIADINALLAKSQAAPVEIRPHQVRVAPEHVIPRLSIAGDGALQVNTHIQLPSGECLEAAGLPPAATYLILSLLNGIGATTGLSNSQIAYKRRGITRDRDMKVLKHLGFAAFILHGAASFALGLPLTDGSRPSSIEELFKTLYQRLGSLLLKAEGWPIQVGSLETLCSTNVTSLIEGFVRQVVRDCEDGRVLLYLPEGEVTLDGLNRKIVAFYHALVSDLVQMTGGTIFERARTKAFEEFLVSTPFAQTDGGEAMPEPPELRCFRATSTNPQAQAFAAGDRSPVYLLPEASRPPRGSALFALSEHGFVVFYDGRSIESFDAKDFRPEFSLVEDSPLILNDTRSIDWFELHPKFFFKGVEITGDQASRLSREGMLEFQGKIYRLKPQDIPSVERLRVFWDRIQAGAARGGSNPGRQRGLGETFYQLPKSQTLDLLALRASGVTVSGGPRWKQICEFYDRLDERREPPTLPPSFQATLKAYQLTGVRWLLDLFDLGLGGILADDMGLGKTVTTLAFLETLRTSKRMGACLIVVPTSLTFNWQSEIERFAPQIPIRVFQSKQTEELLDFLRAEPDGIVITTYGLLQENIGWFGQTPWNIVVFDEAQNLKNIAAKRTTAARQLRGAFKICLTGTPLENHYGEFFSLFDLVLPGGLGDLGDFRERFVTPAAVLRDDIRFLRLKTKPCVLRRTKSQVMQELPPKIETTLKLPFEPEQKRIYRDIAASYNEQVRNAIAAQGEAKTQLQMLTALLRLRQACSDPSSIPNIRYTNDPPKLTVLVEALTSILESGESALVFSQFLATFNRIKAALA